MTSEMTTKSRWPVHGWVGILLVAVFWYLNWSLEGLRTHWGFFPLWLGYCLTVDALVCYRKGTSLLTRSLRAYVGLFLVSAPAWWLFELLNMRVGNWEYLARDQFSDVQYAVLASLSFSTVIPAVFGTAELVGTASWLRNLPRGPRIPRRSDSPWLLLIGCGMLVLLLGWPRYFFPFMWLSVFFILAPLNGRLGYRTLTEDTHRGDWRPAVALAVGCVVCGFFWEFWNFYSYPKWVYHIPFVDFWRVFEMPVLGYGGYIPFSWELFALYHLVIGALGLRHLDNYVTIVDE